MKRHWSKEPTDTYFITNTIVEWKNIFLYEPYVKIILKSWKHFQTIRGIVFNAFAIMPSHLHYVMRATTAKYGIVEMQRDFKKYTAKRIIDGLKYEIEHGKFDMCNVFKRGNIKRETASELLELFKRIGKYSNQQHKIWMPDEKPIVINSDEFMAQKMNYIHMNPVKAHYATEPQDYPYSSARNYYLDDETLFKITRINLLA